MEATQTRPEAPVRTDCQFHYHVAMSQPETHLFEVMLQVKGWQADVLDLKMPVWTPGSYLIREYSRLLQDFGVEDDLTWQKLGKNHWQIQTAGVADVTVRYRMYANELTVRTNHLDATHGYFNGAAQFFFVPGFEHSPIRLTVVPPQSDWQVATTLPMVAQPYTFEAVNFDMLVDCPVEVGIHERLEFEVLGKPHQYVIWGVGNYEQKRLIADTRRIIEAEAALFGGLPYDRYLFLLHLSAQGFGGLEHKDCCTLNYSRFNFRTTEKYNRFMQLVAHEFFHLWNVKRIRPAALEVFNYEEENYTPSLWFSEGSTSFYDLAIPFRAGLYNARAYLRGLSQELSQFLAIPGRRVQPLSESSFDAWIKLYRRDANSNNNQISYYLKGEMVSLLLDLLIRARHDNTRSLDDVMRQMWQQFGQNEIGFTPDQLQQVIMSVADTDLSAFFHHCLHTTEELPFDQYLAPFGLQVQPDEMKDAPPRLGITVKTEHGRDVIKFVEAGSPAQQAGIDAGDELLAIAQLRVTADQLPERLKDYCPGDAISLTFFHHDELQTVSVTLAAARPQVHKIGAIAQPTVEQQHLFQGWLGISLSDLATT